MLNLPIKPNRYYQTRSGCILRAEYSKTSPNNTIMRLLKGDSYVTSVFTDVGRTNRITEGDYDIVKDVTVVSTIYGGRCKILYEDTHATLLQSRAGVYFLQCSNDLTQSYNGQKDGEIVVSSLEDIKAGDIYQKTKEGTTLLVTEVIEDEATGYRTVTLRRLDSPDTFKTPEAALKLHYKQMKVVDA